MSLLDVDGYDIRLARRAAGVLQAFNEAGVLAAADVHVALRLGQLGETTDEDVLLAVALAVRAPRLGHVCVDLAAIRTTASTDLDVPIDLQELPWPAESDWVERLRQSPLMGSGHPLHLEGTTLYLDRFWSEEGQVAADLLALSDAPADGVDVGLLASGLERLFSSEDGPDLQRLAAASAVLRRFSVIAGGPGTGKTTTVARVLVLLDQQASARGRRPPFVALAAPTGKAAARLEEAVHQEATALPIDAEERSRLLQLRGTTLHRLLGFNPGNRSRFRHYRLNRLAEDVVVVDETSMVSLSLMARLVEAVRPDARLILVGDPEQLASVEAGAVLGDVVGPVSRGLLMRKPARRDLARAVGQVVPATDPPGGRPIGDGVVALRRVHRYGGNIGRLAEAIQRGDGDDVVALLSAGEADVSWFPIDIAAEGASAGLDPVRTAAVVSGRRLLEAARAGLALEAIGALGAFRLLCAHRRGPAGVNTWMTEVERWLSTGIEGFATDGLWYVGRPLLVTENDYSLRLYNGDTGVVVATGPSRVMAVFERGGEVVEVSPTRLRSVDTVYAMTVHKAQGSQFDTVAVLLPAPDSPILTRELLYTAVTRAQQRLFVAGTEASIRAAVSRPIARASGLRRALWGDSS
ncbi:MAG TPA: exodeoxyribonuclease V subunit alpha [Acidimicrobiales bacterium]|nr:exodeoxyribonuclease V subunit alpha [Acidimicrobiales bacterium]